MLYRRSPVTIPPDLRSCLEVARLDLLALFRALDQIHLTAGEIPQSVLHQLFELDADYAEALWALDQPPDRFKLRGHAPGYFCLLGENAPVANEVSQNASAAYPVHRTLRGALGSEEPGYY